MQRAGITAAYFQTFDGVAAKSLICTRKSIPGVKRLISRACNTRLDVPDIRKLVAGAQPVCTSDHASFAKEFRVAVVSEKLVCLYYHYFCVGTKGKTA